ncbi:MAG: hypothetical protein NC453_23455 [Muribaculum sp.]|nr:hypothetical protein [Muribaculum sp.]
MGFLNKVKDKIGGAISNTPLVKATMLGSRAVGKTSVMASIFSDTKEEIAGTQLYFRPQPSCAGILNAKKLQLMDVINKRENLTDKPKAGAIEATNVVASFDFEMGMKGREKTIDISIKDFPGEYLDSQPEEVSKYIAESHIVMIAIDTPYLMECGGIYNEEKNEVNHVVSFFRNHRDSLKNKFVLLVPLKCERYFHDRTIDEVSSRITITYSELISFCKENNIACAITPIQTLGGVEFDKFVDNNSAFSKLTKLSSYRFYGDNPQYQPMFCVQPLYYLLTYVANFYEWSKAQPKGFFDRLKDSMTSFLKDDDEFLHEIKKLSMKANVDKFGFRIIANNSILNIK